MLIEMILLRAHNICLGRDIRQEGLRMTVYKGMGKHSSSQSVAMNFDRSAIGWAAWDLLDGPLLAQGHNLIELVLSWGIHPMYTGNP